jgi:predicted amidohydrolase YtcJ
MKILFTNFRWGFDGEPQEMLVEAGTVLARGPSLGPIEDAHPLDLKGAFVLPAFVDSHCHILPTGLDLAKLNLMAMETRQAMLDAVRDRHAAMEPGAWLHAVQYDQNRFPDARHLTRDELDAISPDRPILLRHSNGHASVANSAALVAAGVDESAQDPRGGAFVRDASGRLNGVLLEAAHEKVSLASPKPTTEQMTQAILEAGQKMAELGIACATDMMTGFLDLEQELEAYARVLEAGCPIRIRLFVQWATVFGKRAARPEALPEFLRRVSPDRGKIAGIKIFADGAIASATAAIYGRFLSSTPDGGEDGLLNYPPDRLNAMVRTAHEAGYAVSVHSIGDRATDLVMDAFEGSQHSERDRIEHVMLLSDEQIERLAKLGCQATMQPEFLMRFGTSYRKQLGPERCSRLKRFRSVREAGIPLSFSSDRPIVSGDPWDGVRVVESRPEGFDPSENLSREEGLLGYTAGGAKANGDSGRMGRLEAGELADFAVYDEGPMQAERPRVQALYVAGALQKPAK